MGSITQLMKSACEEKGVEISTNTSVEKILVKNNKAKKLFFWSLETYVKGK